MKRFLLDTNALLRYLLNDIPQQADEIAGVFIFVKKGEAEVTIPLVVFLEAAYVLARVYGFTRAMIKERCEKLFTIPSLDIPDRYMLQDSYSLWVQHPGVSLSDVVLLMIARTSGKELLTFDRKLKSLAKRASKGDY